MRYAIDDFQDFMRLNEKFILSYKNVYKGYWDYGVLLFAIQNSFYIPLQLAYLEGYENEALDTFNLVIDGVFLIDFVVMFFQSYQAKNGNEVKDSIQIFGNYVSQSRFYTDGLSLLGTDVFT